MNGYGHGHLTVYDSRRSNAFWCSLVQHLYLASYSDIVHSNAMLAQCTYSQYNIIMGRSIFGIVINIVL